jgi:hypothetical protein
VGTLDCNTTDCELKPVADARKLTLVVPALARK